MGNARASILCSKNSLIWIYDNFTIQAVNNKSADLNVVSPKNNKNHYDAVKLNWLG